MNLGLRFGVGAALSLAMFAGDIPSASFTPAPAFARDHFRGGGYRGGFRGYRGGYRGGFRGYRGGYYRGGGFGLGDALLGAAIIGGTAAIISSANRPRYDTGYGYGYQTYPVAPGYVPGYAPPPPAAYGDAAGYDDAGGYDDAPPPPPQYGANDPVEQCSRAAEREAQAGGGFARVIGIDKVDPRQNGAHVRGTLEIASGQDRNGNPARTDRTGFVCTADYGQITGLRIG